MRVGLVTGRERIELKEFPDPVPEPGKAVVEIAYCGICGTDLHPFHTGDPYNPAICGHEWTGTVSALGKGVAGLEVGDRKVVDLPSAEAYGERDDSQVTDVPLERLPPNPEIGAVLHARTPDGQQMNFTVIELGETTARLDPNHPLAGLDLVFDVTIVSVESATAEELTHGHVH